MVKDEHLWKKLKAGDRQAFEILFRRYHKHLYRYAVKFCRDKEMAEDQIQNLFLKIWVRKENLGNVVAVKTYLWTALRRELITDMNREDKNLNQKNLADRSSARFSLSIEEFIIKSEDADFRRRQLARAIDSLTSKQREILYLRFYEGMSYQEIEDIMDINYQVARNYLYKSLQNLRENVNLEVSVSSLLMLFFI
jgi:RNA polymerase sigma factor (sigma-70 family)